MTSMGDLGRELEQLAKHPMPAHPPTELDELEARLKAFFAWAQGRPHGEIRSRFVSEFTPDPLHDDVVAAMSEGRGGDLRHRLPVATPAPPETA
jgi:hypothetical protein